MQIVDGQPLSDEELAKVDAYWRAANHLAVGEIYLAANRCCANRCVRSTSSTACSGTAERRPG